MICLKIPLLVATVTDGDGLTPAFHATKTVSKCHRVVWKNSQFCHHKEAYKESQPLILHQATERSEHTRTFKTHQTEYQALGTLQSPDHHWNTFSAGDPVALCAPPPPRLHLLYVASVAPRNCEDVLFYLWLSLGHAWVCIMEGQRCESKVAARTQKWRGHALQRRSLFVARVLFWAPGWYTRVGRYLFSSVPTLWLRLTREVKERKSSSWKFFMAADELPPSCFVFSSLCFVSDAMFCRWLCWWILMRFPLFSLFHCVNISAARQDWQLGNCRHWLKPKLERWFSHFSTKWKQE